MSSLLILYFLAFLFSSSNAADASDDALRTFVRELPTNARLYESEDGIEQMVNGIFTKGPKALNQKETIFPVHLGILQLMKKGWDCGKEVVEQPFRTECEKYKLYMDILYEYLFRVYSSGDAPVKLKFHLKKAKRSSQKNYTAGPLIETVYSLNGIAPFFFRSQDREQIYDNEFERVFAIHDRPILENEEQMKQIYGPKEAAPEAGSSSSTGQAATGSSAAAGAERAAKFAKVMVGMAQMVEKIKQNGHRLEDEYRAGITGISVIWCSPFLRD